MSRYRRRVQQWWHPTSCRGRVGPPADADAGRTAPAPGRDGAEPGPPVRARSPAPASWPRSRRRSTPPVSRPSPCRCTSTTTACPSASSWSPPTGGRTCSYGWRRSWRRPLRGPTAIPTCRAPDRGAAVEPSERALVLISSLTPAGKAKLKGLYRGLGTVSVELADLMLRPHYGRMRVLTERAATRPAFVRGRHPGRGATPDRRRRRHRRPARQPRPVDLRQRERQGRLGGRP